MLSSQLSLATTETVAGKGQNMNAIRVLCFGLVLLIAGGQDTNVSTITGVVLDANNARIVDTLIKIENAKTRQHVKSDDEGRFRIELPAGDYQITAEHRGFKKFEFSPFRAQPGACELVNIHMEVEVPKSPQKIH